jgi:hypothetical protein
MRIPFVVLFFAAPMMVLCVSHTAEATGLCSTTGCGTDQTIITADAGSATAFSVTEYGANSAAIEAISPSTVIIAVSAGGTGSTGVAATNNTATGGTGVSGESKGGYGVSGVDDTTGTGVYGEATGGYGVYGQDTSTGAGVHGQSSTGNGVIGVSSNTSETNAKAGVYGSNSSGGWAGYFDGPLRIPSAADLCTPTCASDSRLKKNVQPMVGVLDQLLRLHGVTFEWKDTTMLGHLSGTHKGFIAQDVEKVFPSWVGADGDGFKTLGVEPREGFALTVEALRELKIKNDELEARLKVLEDARRPMISYNPNWGIFAAGLVIGGVLLINNRRKRSESEGKA